MTLLPSNLEIARRTSLKPLAEIAAEMGIGPHLFEPYGEGVARIKLEAFEQLADRPKAPALSGAALPTT